MAGRYLAISTGEIGGNLASWVQCTDHRRRTSSSSHPSSADALLEVLLVSTGTAIKGQGKLASISFLMLMAASIIIIRCLCWLFFVRNLPSGESSSSNNGGCVGGVRRLQTPPGADALISLSSLPSSTFAFVATRQHNRRSTRQPLFVAVPTVLDDTHTSSPPSSSPSSNTSHDIFSQQLNKSDDPFTLLSTIAATTLLQSDRRRDAVGKESGAQASSATNWIDEGCAFTLRKALDKMELYFPNSANDNGGGGGCNNNIIIMDATVRRRRDEEATTWLRWMRSVPSPVLVDLSTEARRAADGIVSDDFLGLLNANANNDDNNDNSSSTQTSNSSSMRSSKMNRLRIEFLNRLQCRLILLPSGQGLRGGLREPAGSLTFAKLLCGGATRYRILPSSTSSSGSSNDATIPSTTKDSRPARRAGERTERKSSRGEHVPSWVQYGGTERRYDAVDMGPAMILEWTLLPKIRGGDDGENNHIHDVVGVGGNGVERYTSLPTTDMVLQRLGWKPQNMFQYVKDEDIGEANGSGGEETTSPSSSSFDTPSSLQGKDRNDALSSDFRSRVGGLGYQIDAIVRRVLDGRVIRPAEVDAGGNFLSYVESRRMLDGEGEGITGSGSANNDDFSSLDDASRRLSLAALEAEELASLGLTPVKGLLLYGPPGCGKTALAREIARALRARAPKIVSAPELLDRWVGGSERLVRELFQDAEAELASVNGDASRSALHVIVIDEIDAVFRKRSSAEDSGEATRSSTVNQILSKLDGVEAISNVLLIGMTNRREILDEALLRPGRLEVQIEIPLPDREGRREILQIHFGALRRRGRLSQPLCDAIDGTICSNGDISSPKSRKGRKRRAVKQAANFIMDTFNPVRKAVFDLADNIVTGGFSGADLEGLVRCSGSIALSRARQEGAGIDGLLITLDDVKLALIEVKS